MRILIQDDNGKMHVSDHSNFVSIKDLIDTINAFNKEGKTFAIKANSGFYIFSNKIVAIADENEYTIKYNEMFVN